MHRHVLHAGQIRLLSIQPLRLQTVERVVWPKMVRQLAIEQHVAPCAMDKEQAGLRALRLNRDQGGPPLRSTWPFVNLPRQLLERARLEERCNGKSLAKLFLNLDE